jgi:hypothetical protein
VASPIGRQASEHLEKSLVLFHRVVGKKIFDRSNLSILGVMRWNLLFDELENGFEELLANQSAPTPKAPNQFPNLFGELLLAAQSAKKAVLVLDVGGGEFWLTPRAVGRDWVSGRLGSGGERIILLEALVAVHSEEHRSEAQSALAPISISGVLQIWKNRGEAIRVTTRSENFVGQLGDVSDLGVTLFSLRSGKPARWLIPFRHMVSVEGVSEHGTL